jgi:SAM-dependent methyltransferase
MAMTDTAASWSDVAPAWERNAEFVEHAKAPLTERLLELLDLRQGERVLELGAGPGLLARRLADIVGPSGHLVVSDVADGMVAAARRRLDGVPGVDVRQLDASATGLPDRSQDAVVFRMGLMLIVDPVTAVAEIRRLLDAGGRAGVAVWAGPEHNPWLSIVGMAAMVHGLVTGGPPVGPGELYSLADPAELQRTIKDGGFDDVSVEAVDIVMRFDSLDSYFSHVVAMAGPLAAVLAAAPPEQLAAAQQTVAQLAERFATDRGLDLPGRALVAIARK